jgi:hypothetical protein
LFICYSAKCHFDEFHGTFDQFYLLFYCNSLLTVVLPSVILLRVILPGFILLNFNDCFIYFYVSHSAKVKTCCVSFPNAVLMSVFLLSDILPIVILLNFMRALLPTLTA